MADFPIRFFNYITDSKHDPFQDRPCRFTMIFTIIYCKKITRKEGKGTIVESTYNHRIICKRKRMEDIKADPDSTFMSDMTGTRDKGVGMGDPGEVK